MALRLGLRLGIGQGVSATEEALPTSPVFLFDGSLNTNDGERVTKIADQVSAADDNLAFIAAADARFYLDGIYPTKTVADSEQAMVRATAYSLSASQVSVILAVKVTGGSQIFPSIVQSSSNTCAMSGLASNSPFTCAFGANIMNGMTPAHQCQRGSVAYASFPYTMIITHSYDKTVSGNRSISVWIKDSSGVISLSNSIAASNDNANNVVIKQLGRSYSSNASTFTFYHLSGYNKLLSAHDQTLAIKYLINKYSL